MLAAPRPARILLLAAALLPQAPAAPPRASERAAGVEPAVLGPFEVVRVVDADTLHVRRGRAVEKLRLLSVDTEERLSGTGFDPGKPETVFGEECALWAAELIEGLAEDGGRPRVRLVLPEGRERRDVFGRLLCYVLLPDGRNFNLLLVEEGKSPYFNKYGDSLLFHEAFVAAQASARARKLGIWDPATNRPRTRGAPEARRDYGRLLPWWEKRARAIGEFRSRRAEDPSEHVAADDPEALDRALARGKPVQVFGEVQALLDERDGSWTVLLAADDKARAVRARIPAQRRAAFEDLRLARLARPYQPNHVWITGTLRADGRGFELDAGDPRRWRIP